MKLWAAGRKQKEIYQGFLFSFNTEVFFASIHANGFGNPSLKAKAAADKAAPSHEMPFERLGNLP